MAQTMNASQPAVSDGQIDTMVEQFRAALRKKRDQYGLQPFQQVLGLPNLGMRLIQPLSTLVELYSDVITRDMPIYRNLSPEALVAALRWHEDVRRNILKTMPKGEGQGTVVFFQTEGQISGNDIAKEYEARGLIRDPYAVLTVLEADPSLADERTIVAPWEEETLSYGQMVKSWNEISFQKIGARGVVRVETVCGWGPGFWFGGLRKQP